MKKQLLPVFTGIFFIALFSSASVQWASWKCWDNLQAEWFVYTTKKMSDGTCWTSTPMKHWETLVGTGMDVFPKDDSKIEKWCHGDKTENCEKYWALYTWYEAMWISSGSTITQENLENSVCWKLWADWQLPENQDFLNLTKEPNNCTGWTGNKMCDLTSVKWGDLNSTNPRKFIYLNTYQNWWSANQYNAASWKYSMIGTNASVTVGRTVPKLHAMSVICVKKTPDIEEPETPKFQEIVLQGSGVITDMTITWNTIRISGKDLWDYDIPVLYDTVDVTYEKWVANTYNQNLSDGEYLNWNDVTKKWSTSPWKNVSYTRSATGAFVTSVSLNSQKEHTRYGSGNRYYAWEWDAHIQEPRVYPKFGTWAESKKIYVSWWLKQDNDTRYQFKVQLKNISPNFNPKENDMFIVPQVWDWRKVTHFTGRVVAFDKTTGTLEAVFYGQNNTNYIIGRPIVLSNGSGQAEVESKLMSQWANKFIRMWESDGTAGTFRVSWTQSQLQNLWNWSPVPEKTWTHMEIFIDQETKRVQTFINGKKDVDVVMDEVRIADAPIHSPTIGLIGFDSSVPVIQKIALDDIYLDNKFNRIELSTEANYENVEHREIQFYKNWADWNIEFEFNTGNLDASKTVYMYIFDGNGNLKNQQWILVK